MDSLIFLIKAKLEKLPDSERKIAEFILKERKNVIYWNLSELAENAGSSQSAVIRLCKKLGIPGFQELKIMLARDVFGRKEEKFSPSFELDVEKNTREIVGNVISGSIQLMKDLEGFIDLPAVERAVDLIETAKFIQFFGIGTSGIVALDFYHKLERIGHQCSYINDSHLQLTAACILKEGSLGIFISYSGETSEMVKAAKEVKSNGARILTLTKKGRSALADLSDVALFVPVSESVLRQGASSSRIAQLIVIDIIFLILVSRQPDKSITLLERTLKATQGAL